MQGNQIDKRQRNQQCVYSKVGWGQISMSSVLSEHKLRSRRKMKTEVKVEPEGDKLCMSSQGL